MNSLYYYVSDYHLPSCILGYKFKMNLEEIRKLLDLISDACDLDLILGFNAFVEKAFVWSEGYNILIQYDAIGEDCFECLISIIKKVNKHWKLVERVEEPFILIYSSSFIYQMA